MTDYYRQIAQALLEPMPSSREEAVDRFKLALAELKEDPRWKVLEERTLARLATIVRDLIEKAGDPNASCGLAGEARCLLEMLAAPHRANRSLKERAHEVQGQEGFERLGEPEGWSEPGTGGP